MIYYGHEGGDIERDAVLTLLVSSQKIIQRHIYRTLES